MNMQLEGLDRGLGEGCAFRGRVLLQLTVTNGRTPTPDEAVMNIVNDDLFAIQPFLRRRKFRLFVSFLEASMISPVDGPVEFEVSIGDFGNKFSASYSPVESPSTTQPLNAVFDGQNYYYMPWRDIKPCIMLISHWEDNTFRIESLNMILKTIDKLEMNLGKVRLLLRSEAPIEDTARQLMSLLDDLISDLSCHLPELPDKGYTDLDQKMHNLRTDDMATIRQEACELKENAVDIFCTVAEIEGYLSRLQIIAVEVNSRNRPNQEILVPDWLITSNVT
eukprot:sb/3467974/